MRIALLVFGQDVLDKNIIEIKKSIPNIEFDLYILSNKESVNISKSHNVKLFSFWEDQVDCHELENIMIKNNNMWYRRYILWKLFEQSPEYSSYDYCIFISVCDSELKPFPPMKKVLDFQESPQTLFIVNKNVYIGSRRILKKLFLLGSNIEYWKPSTFSKNSEFSSEVMVLNYIFKTFPKWKNIAESPSQDKASPIPNKILQIAIGDKYTKSLPLDFLKNNLLNLNHDYEYTFYTDREIAHFLQTHFPQYINLYNIIQRPQYKSDLIRYLYIYKFGGWYIDIDLLPFIPLTEIYNKTSISKLILVRGGNSNPENGVFEICNGFIATVKENPIFLELVECMVQDPNPEDYGANVKKMYKVLENKYGIELFKNNKGLFLFKEALGENDKYYFFYNEEVIGLSNAHGYPHTFFDQLK
jgi:hypothetical protein